MTPAAYSSNGAAKVACEHAVWRYNAARNAGERDSDVKPNKQRVTHKPDGGNAVFRGLLPYALRPIGHCNSGVPSYLQTARGQQR